jgi:ADP-heptose:LPS heptosyltransferase
MKMLSRFDKEPYVHKIAVVRANALGDFICILPALNALRVAYPESEIALLAKNWHASFLNDRPGPVDRVIVVPPYGGVSEEPGGLEDPVELECFFHAMQEEHFDLAFQVHVGPRPRLHTALRERTLVSQGREPTPSAAIIDSQSVKTREIGGGAATMAASG